MSLFILLVTRLSSGMLSTLGTYCKMEGRKEKGRKEGERGKKTKEEKKDSHVSILALRLTKWTSSVTSET